MEPPHIPSTRQYRIGCRCCGCKQLVSEYNYQRYNARKADVFLMIGEECARCGSTENLEVDHIDPTGKSFPVLENLHRRWEVIAEELLKCQALCHECHRAKTKQDYADGKFSCSPVKRAA